MVVIKARPTIANVTMTDADTEYSYEIPAGTRYFKIKLRDIGFQMKLAVVEGDSGTTYITLQQAQLYETDAKGGSITLYFQSSQANMVAEIMTFK